MVSIQNFYFLVYTTIATGMIVMSVISALTSRSSLSRSRLILILVTCGLAVPLTGAAAISAAPGLSSLELASLLLPVVYVLAIWCNFQSSRRLGIGFEVMHVPVLLWNALLAVSYAIRASHLLFQNDLGDTGSGILATLSVLQQNVGDVDSELAPLHLYLPLLIPPAAGSEGFSLTTKVSGAFLSCVLVAVFVMALPQGVATALSQRKPPRTHELLPRGDIRVSMQLPDFGQHDEPGLSLSSLAPQIARTRELGFDRFELVVDAGVTERPERVKQLGEAIDLIRQKGLGLVLITAEPGRFRDKPAVAANEYVKAMESAHWLLAERFRPDLLVIYRRPAEQRLRARLGHLPMPEWIRIIEGSIKALRIGHPEQKLGVDLEIGNEDAREIYAALGKSNLREIRLIVAGNRMGRNTLVRSLLTVSSWMAVHPTTRQLGLIAQPPAPLGFCGFEAQRLYAERVIAFANRQPLVSSVCLGPITDVPESWNGFWDTQGRPRPVLAHVAKLLATQHPARPSSR